MLKREHGLACLTGALWFQEKGGRVVSYLRLQEVKELRKVQS